LALDHRTLAEQLPQQHGNLTLFPVRSPTGSSRMLLLRRAGATATSKPDPLQTKL
jgi:hypothetical protein